MEENNIIGEKQVGFRSLRSTLNHIFTLNLIIDLYLQTCEKVNTVFIDYRKAFDLIETSSLWHKVLSHNINRKLFNVIHTLQLSQSMHKIKLKYKREPVYN